MSLGRPGETASPFPRSPARLECSAPNRSGAQSRRTGRRSSCSRACEPRTFRTCCCSWIGWKLQPYDVSGTYSTWTFLSPVRSAGVAVISPGGAGIVRLATSLLLAKTGSPFTVPT